MVELAFPHDAIVIPVSSVYETCRRFSVENAAPFFNLVPLYTKGFR